MSFYGHGIEAQSHAQLISAVTEVGETKPQDFRVTDVSGPAGEHIDLNITSDPEASPEDIFTITGLPEDVKITAGKLYDDMWLLHRKDLAGLAILTPAGFKGTFQIMLTRTRVEKRAPVAMSITVSVVDKAQVIAPRPVAIAYSRSVSDTVLFDKAYEQFKKGDVSGARAVFEYLATKGDPQAAIAMGETYDPVVLAQLYIKGLHPDEAKAVGWYRKAEQLGDAKASNRLNALNQK